jgi:hypothetical protein
VLVALGGGLCSVFRPVQAALLPWLARTPDELASANTAASVMQAVAVLVGPAIAAGLLSVGTAQSATFVTCGLVAAAAVLLAGVRPPRVYSALQRVIPPRRMGRALGARRAVLLLSVGLGSAVAPPLVHAFGARATLTGVGLLLIAIAIVSVPSLKAVDSRLSAAGPEVALLRRVSFFGPLPLPRSSTWPACCGLRRTSPGM